jgi:DNA repair protein RadC
MATYNLVIGGKFDTGGIVWPLLVAVSLATYYHKLGHLRELIASVPTEKIDAAKRICKTLLKKKLKKEPLVVGSSDGRCRAQLIEDRFFFIQKDLMRAFVGTREAFRKAIVKQESKKWTAVFNHPLGKLKCSFDKKNTEKLRTWLATEQAPTTA